MNDNTRGKSIAIVVAILIIGAGLLSWIIPTLSKENEKKSTSNTGIAQTTIKTTPTNTTPPTPKSNCLTPAETWNNVGKTTCVEFTPAKIASSNGYFFIDEKVDYTKGFVVFIGTKNIMNWNSFYSKYNGKKIRVSGKIELYKGYPQIKVYDLSKIEIIN
jgi:hypothetical protein